MPLTPAIWLAEFTVNLTTADSQARPRITHLANGNILVVWDSTDNTGVGDAAGTDLIGQLFNPLGTPIGTEFRANQSFFSDDERNADVAALASGGFVVAFEDFDVVNNNRSIRLTEWNADATVSNTVTIIGDASNNADPAFFNPRVAASSDISVLVVYQEEEVGGDSRIAGVIYNSSTDTVGSVISLINFPGNNTAPSVAVLDNGDYVIAAASDDTVGNQSISIRIINATGGNVLGVTPIADTDGDSQNDREPSVTALTNGGFVVSWTNTDVNDTDIQARVFNSAGVAQGSLIEVTLGGATDNANESAVVALNDGGFIVFFDDDELGELRGVRYDSTGTSLTGEFVVSSDGSGIDEIDAELLADGRVAVTFERANGEIGMEIIDTRDAANDPAVYGPPGWMIGTIHNDTITGTANADVIAGHDGEDTISGGGGADTLTGGNGNDTLNGGAGIDSISGGFGNDNYFLDNALDVVIEAVGRGTDRVWSAGSYTLAAGQEIETLSTTSAGGVNAISLTGNQFNNSIFGNNGANALNGGLGVDRLTGLLGNDNYFVDNALDVVIEAVGGGTDRVWSAGSYTLAAGQEIETLSTTSAGGVNAINLTGNAFNNTIFGNSGANVLNGGLGNDTLSGLLGADTFVFNTALNAATNRDTIMDYNSAADTIRLENTGAGLFNTLALGVLNALFFKANATGTATDADDRIIYNTVTGALFYDSNGNAAGGAIQFATLNTHPVIIAADFVVV